MCSCKNKNNSTQNKSVPKSTPKINIPSVVSEKPKTREQLIDILKQRQKLVQLTR